MLTEKIKKILKKSSLVLPVLLFLTAYSLLPKRVTVVEGQNIDFGFGLTETINAENEGEYTCDVKILNVIPVKTVDVSVIPKTYLIPSGEAIGVKLYTEGVLVVGMSDVTDKDGKVHEPGKAAGLMVGDRILAVNGKTVKDIDDFSEKINEAEEKAVLEVARENSKFQTEITPVYSEEANCYKIGLWVRDSTAGIGTLTFYNPKDKTFGALGHGICDSDTKELMVVREGSVNSCKIRSVIKGKKGIAGELSGDFSGLEIGDITRNTGSGIRGVAKEIHGEDAMLAASRFEVKKGKARILCDIDGNGPFGYDIEITKVSHREDGKNMVIKVTDERLIKKTGGIVQGMSGSPIIQNGKIVGAVTHVFVNDPTRGYGIFIENMLDMTA